MSRKKILGSPIRMFVSTSLLRISKVIDARGRELFRLPFVREEDYPGILVFLDMFPAEPFPHLCRYVFLKQNGSTEVVDSFYEPSEDLALVLVQS